MWEPARWLVGTAELDAMTEFVFFRLCMIAYEAGDPIVSGSDRRTSVRCKVDIETYRGAIMLLVELDKIELVDTGIFLKSVARRLDDAGTRIAGRQRGASIARRRGILKAEGLSKSQIDLIISEEFPDDQPEKPTHTKQTEQTGQNKQTEKGGSRDLLGDLVPENADVAAVALKMWNDLADKHGLPKAQVLSETRRKSIKLRVDEAGGLEGWGSALEMIEQSPFLLGKKNDFRADLDFVLQRKSFIKLMEGSYSGTSGPRGSAAMESIRNLYDDANRN